MTRLTSSQLTELKLKHSSVGGRGGRGEAFAKVILLSLASRAAVSAVRIPTDQKNKLKLFTTVDMFFLIFRWNDAVNYFPQ